MCNDLGLMKKFLKRIREQEVTTYVSESQQYHHFEFPRQPVQSKKRRGNMSPIEELASENVGKARNCS
jgi:hypothetical protein